MNKRTSPLMVGEQEVLLKVLKFTPEALMYVRFNVTLALELLKDQLQDGKFGPLINLITSYLLENPGGSELRWKVIGKLPNQFLIILIPAQDCSELQKIDAHFGTDRTLWADAGEDNGTFSLCKYTQPDSAFTFVGLDTLRFQLERRDEITDGINGLFQIVMTKDRAILPMALYRQALAMAMETAIRAYKSGISASCQEPIRVTISHLDEQDRTRIGSIRAHFSHLTLDELVAKCRQIIVLLRRFPFRNGEKETTLLENYDPEALITTA